MTQLMNVLGAAVIAAGLLALVWCLMKLRTEKAPKEEEAWPLETMRGGHLLTDAEWFVYERLSTALDKHHVLCKVAMGQLLTVSKETRKAKQGDVKWKAKIDRQALDYVVCASDGKVVAVVELDDASHAKLGQQSADQAKDRALKSAGVHLVRWTMRTLPNRDDELRREILEPKRSDADGELEGGDVVEPLPRLA